MSERRIHVSGADAPDPTDAKPSAEEASAERAQRAEGERSSSGASAERAQRAEGERSSSGASAERAQRAEGERSSSGASAERAQREGGEGWESLAEESVGTLAPSPELEEALREAAEAVEERGQARERPRAGTPPGPSPRETELAAELEVTRDRYLRLHADFENFRRRASKERLEAEQYGHQNLVKDLLTAVDNLDRAIDHARRSAGEDLESLLQGVELVRRELVTALGKHGVTAIETTGRPFDPALHEAMAQAPDDSVAPNTVIEELQKGYVLRDRLLRPARVIVSRRSGGEGESRGG